MPTQTFQNVAIGVTLLLVCSAAPADNAAPNLVEHSKVLTADELAAWVLERNPGIVAIEATAEAAAFRIEPAGSLDDPIVSYALAPQTAGGNQSLNQRFDFKQKIPWPGTLAARERAAQHEANAAEFDIDLLRLRVVAQTKAAYAEWQFVHSAIEIHHSTQNLLDELVSNAETRYATGRALKQDVLQGEVEQTNLEKHLFSLIRLEATMKARINALLNRAPNEPLPPAGGLPEVSELYALEDMRRMAIARHPELAQLEARISASESRITLAEKAFYPDLELGVGYNRLWDAADKRTTIGVSVNIPFNRSKRRSELGRAQAERRSAEWTLIERRAALLADLTKAHAEVVEAKSSVGLLHDRLLPLSAEYLEAAIADYQSGIGAFLNVITAEQRALDTELALARARSDYARRVAELERWVGGPVDATATSTSGVQQ